MRYVLAGTVIVVYLLHQDWWFWTAARPLVFGFMPVGLFYHGVYCLLCSALMILLVRFSWPVPFDEPAASSPRSEEKGR